MSHMIDRLAYTGETPWHGLGRRLPKHATIDQMIDEAGLGFEVVECPLFADLRSLGYTGDKRGVRLEDRKALVRKDNGVVLSDVGTDYGYVPYRDCFEIAAAAVGEDKACAEVGATLDEGRRAFILLSMASLDVAGDEVKPYLLVYAGHDGRTPIACRFTPVRVVCQNTLTAAIGHKDSTEIRIRHTSNAAQRVAQAAIMIASAREYFGAFHIRAQRLVKQSLGMNKALDITTALFPAKRNATGQLIVPAMGAKVLQLFAGQDRVRQDAHLAGTAWGYFQALTAALDHNGRNGGPTARLNRSIQGTQDALRGKALELLAA